MLTLISHKVAYGTLTLTLTLAVELLATNPNFGGDQFVIVLKAPPPEVSHGVQYLFILLLKSRSLSSLFFLIPIFLFPI